MRRPLRAAFAAACVVAAPPAWAQAGAAGASDVRQADRDVRRALGNQPMFPNLRGGTLGVPSLTGQESVSAQAAVRIDGDTPVVDLFANFGNIDLTPRVALSLFAESARLDAPRAAFDPSAAAAPNPLPTLDLQSFQGIGFRLRVRLSSGRDGVATRARGLRDHSVQCNQKLQALRIARAVLDAAPGSANAQRDVDDAERARAAVCGDLRADTLAAYTESFYRLRVEEMFGGPQLFFGARYVYRGTPATGAAASGVAAELGYLHQLDASWRVYLSGSFSWLARAQSMEGTNAVVLPALKEFRANAGVSWRPLFNPDRSFTVGLQASLAFNLWDNEFARGAQERAIQGRSIEASVFASGHLGSNVNGLVSFGVLVPYGATDDGPRFVFTFAPAAAAATKASDEAEDAACVQAVAAQPPAAQPPAAPAPVAPVDPAPAGKAGDGARGAH